MFGKLSRKRLVQGIFFWLGLLLILGVMRLFREMAYWPNDVMTNMAINQRYSEYVIFYIKIRIIILPLSGAFLLWHGCDVLYRILGVCNGGSEKNSNGQP